MQCEPHSLFKTILQISCKSLINKIKGLLSEFWKSLRFNQNIFLLGSIVTTESIDI